MTATAINTKAVTGRRELHFSNLDEIFADGERLMQAKEIRTLGNWSPGETFQHLAIAMHGSIDGDLPRAPLPIRMIARLVMKRRFLTKPMAPGFMLPKGAAALLPPPVSLEEGFENYRRGFERLKTETKRGPHPALGYLSRDEWNLLHCRHSELHQSFLIPVE